MTKKEQVLERLAEAEKLIVSARRSVNAIAHNYGKSGDFTSTPRVGGVSEHVELEETASELREAATAIEAALQLYKD